MKMLFVCTGNACRSAAAEAVMKKMLADNGMMDIEVSSCGTRVPEGLDREEVMCNIAAERGYVMGGKARRMNVDLLDAADIIIVMTDNHRNEVTRLLSYSHWPRIVRFNDYCFGVLSDLADPHYQAEHVYRSCFDTIERGCDVIIKKIRNEKRRT
ncbi:MAG: hypothetical protein K2F79_01360 [Muribaculaceae bacterium]|nr:hypothetical protein [Muribaculaceae bacterium]